MKNRDRERAAKSLVASDDVCSTELVELTGTTAQMDEAFDGIDQVAAGMMSFREDWSFGNGEMQYAPK